MNGYFLVLMVIVIAMVARDIHVDNNRNHCVKEAIKAGKTTVEIKEVCK
jgi:hypothetical protein